MRRKDVAEKMVVLFQSIFSTNWQRGDIGPVQIRLKVETLKTYAKFKKSIAIKYNMQVLL